MSENTAAVDTATEDVPETPTEDTAVAADQGNGDDGTNDELTPDVLRKQLDEARKEAAKYRVNARELREQLSTAKSTEDFEAVTAKAAQLEVDLHTERLGRKFNLPDGIAQRITGDTEEAREADAKSLAALFHKSDSAGTGGLDPSAKAITTDPAAIVASIPRARR